MSNKIRILNIILLTISFFYGCGNSHDYQTGKNVVLRLEPSENNPRNSEGDFIKLKNGNILFVYTHFTGGTGDHASAYLASRISKDKGKSWSNRDQLVVPNEAGMNVMSVSLIRLQNDKIALFYLRKNSVLDCLPIMRTSGDEGITWSEPKICISDPGYYVLNNDRAVQLKGGRIILPVAQHNSPDFEKRHPGILMCYYSDDDGMTWNKSDIISNPERVTSQEPGIVELLDGRLLLFSRTNAGVQYTAYSNDGGISWSQLKPGNIKSPLSPASIERIPSTNDLVLVWNNNYEGGENGGRRTPFNISISKDEGISWENIKTLESDPDGWYCYTAIEFVDDNILLAHCAGDRKKYGGLETTQLSLIDIDWLYKPSFSDPYVEFDKNGIIRLNIDEPDSKIYYTLDGSLPTYDSGILYDSPIEIDRTTLIKFKAYGKGTEESAIKVNYIGTDIYQAPVGSADIMHANLKYRIYECELNSTEDINDKYIVDSGLTNNFNLSVTELDTNFAVIYDCYLKINKKGKYTFSMESNDGSVFFLNDRLLIDNDGLHTSIKENCSTSLLPGFHKVKVKYFQQGGGKKLQIGWSGPDFSYTSIPDSLMFNY